VAGFPCDNCGQECRRDCRHADMVCPDCGLCHPDAVSNQAIHSMSYEEYGAMKCATDAHSRKNCYKRVNYFKELIKNMTDTRSDTLPAPMLEELRGQMEEWRHTREQGRKVEVKEIRRALKDRKMGKYYPHVHAIHRHVSGVSKAAVSLTHQETDRLISMFAMSSNVFDRLGVDRKNGLNYSYTMAQLLTIIGRKDCCAYINGLKCRKRLKKHDTIWQEICNCLSLPFYSIT